MTISKSTHIRFTPGPRNNRWVALSALTLLLGCGAHDADVAAPSIVDDSVEPSDSLVNTPVVSDETGLLGVSTSVLSADEKGRSPTAEDLGERLATTNHRSGARLQARLLSTSEGQLTWQGWQDSELGEECSFQLDDEGTFRCFPVNGIQELVYSNSECTRGFVSDDPTVDQASPRYYFYRKDTACGEGIRAYDLADTSEVLSSVYVRNAQHECVPVDAVGRSFRALAAPVDPERFVAAEYGTIASSSRIKAYGLLADDGAVQVTGFIDEELETPCMWTGADTASCLPHGQIIDRFADPEMSIPLLKDETANCSEPMASVGVQPDAAGTARYYRRGAPFEGDVVYGTVPQSIAGPAAIAAQGTYYQAEEISATGFAKATVTSDVTSRLNAVYWNTEANDTWFSHWYDLALGSSCTFVADARGGALCLPDTTGSRLVYTDTTCGQPVAEIDANCGDARPQFAAEHVTDQDNATQINIRRLQAATPLQAFYDKTESGCVLRAARGDKQYFDLSAPLPAEAFVSASPVDTAEPTTPDEEIVDPLR
jgi:hypothetical protein